MKITVISMSGNETIYDITAFEMRANRLTNWVKLTLPSGGVLTIYGVATLKMGRNEDD